MRICVIGTGAIGTLYAARLALAGHEVTMLSSSAGTAAAIARDGLRLEEPDGAHAVPMRAAADPAALPRAEAALVLTDATRTAAAAGLAAGVLEADGFAVTLQNGIGNAEILADALGEARVAAGVTYHSAAGERPGHARHTNDGRTIMGEVDGRRSPRLDRLAAALGDTGFKVTVSDDVTGAIWSKLVLNCAVNPICAVTGLRTGEIALSPDADAVQDGIVAEALAVVAAKGIRLSFDDPVARVK
ncbi:MAG TPA: ketopantoate reductase family protein, partial [Alphaproteobacteria bacterium]|nr:ketopantoate reductase family protein [Alphaproteobacteria bacterium]